MAQSRRYKSSREICHITQSAFLITAYTEHTAELNEDLTEIKKTATTGVVLEITNTISGHRTLVNLTGEEADSLGSALINASIKIPQKEEK